MHLKHDADADPEEVVLFCAGLRQLVMSVGVAQAYLVTGRRPDHIVGMSAGSLAAARVQAVFAAEVPGDELIGWHAQVRDIEGQVDDLWQSSWVRPDRLGPLDAADRQALDHRKLLWRVVARSTVTIPDVAGAFQRWRARTNARRPLLASIAALGLVGHTLKDAVLSTLFDGSNALSDLARLRDHLPPRGGEDTFITLFVRAAVRDKVVEVLGEDWTPARPRPGVPCLTVAATPLATIASEAGSEDAATRRLVQLALDLGEAPIDRLVDAMWSPGLWPAAPPHDVHERRGHGRRPVELPSTTRIGDAALARSNPIPAFFRRFEGHGPPLRLRVVYADPFEERAEPLPDQPWRIGKVAATALRATRREDIALEHRQTYITSALLQLLDEVEADAPRRLRRAHISCIAPEHEARASTLTDALGLGGLDHPVHIDRIAAQACRSLLEALHCDSLAALSAHQRGERSLTPAQQWLEQVGQDRGQADCHSFLATEARTRGLDWDRPPLADSLCAQCPGCLRPPREESLSQAAYTQGPAGSVSGETSAHVHIDGTTNESARHRIPATVHQALRRPDTARRPRVVLLSEGGVFRGSFQVGAMAALGLLKLQPDVIAGASIGSGMGAFTAAMFHRLAARPRPEGVRIELQDDVVDVISAAVRAYVEVESEVAGTARLEQVVQRAFTTMSSQSLRLCDLTALADPVHRTPVTRALGELLAAPVDPLERFVDALQRGQLVVALRRFDQALQGSTLGTSAYLMGTAGLDRALNAVMSAADVPGWRTAQQPFLSAGMGFFATATRLETEGQVLLGAATDQQGYPEVASWSFPHMLHGSAAFPGLFEPVSHALLHPADHALEEPVHLIDGGVFDNLPVVPAIDVVAALQDGEAAARPTPSTPRQRLRDRLAVPDLFVVVSLDDQPVATEHSADHSFSAQARVRSAGGKLASLRSGTRRLRPLLEALADSDDDGSRHWDELVAYQIVLVEPTVLNGTFHFEAAMGLDDHRLDRSIVDGCHQTLHSVTAAWADEATAPSLTKTACRRLLSVDDASEGAACPHFRGTDGRRVACPMASMKGRTGRWLRNVCAERDRWPSG